MVGELAYHPPSMGQPSGTIFTEPVLVVNQKVKDIHRRYWRRERAQRHR